MSTIANNITVDYTDQNLTIDGNEFPWWIDQEPVVHHRDDDDCVSTVTVTIMCRNVVEKGTPRG